MNRKILIIIIFFSFASGAALALNSDFAIKKIRMGSPVILSGISLSDMKRLHNYNDQYYYIPRFIGQKSIRSLLGCFKNSDVKVRKICADNLYQLKLTFVHKKLLIHYWKKESDMATKLALQDVLVKISDDRFIRAREQGDPNFLAKVSYDEISEFIEKGAPPGDKYTQKDFQFLKGGTLNKDERVQIYSVQMLGRLQDQKSNVLRLLNRLKGRFGRNDKLINEIETSIKCQNEPATCPDIGGR